jgi:hypothetical protein
MQDQWSDRGSLAPLSCVEWHTRVYTQSSNSRSTPVASTAIWQHTLQQRPTFPVPTHEQNVNVWYNLMVSQLPAFCALPPLPARYLVCSAITWSILSPSLLQVTHKENVPWRVESMRFNCQSYLRLMKTIIARLTTVHAKHQSYMSIIYLFCTAQASPLLCTLSPCMMYSTGALDNLFTYFMIISW